MKKSVYERLDLLACDLDSMSIIASCLLSSSDLEKYLISNPELAHIALDKDSVDYLVSVGAL